jgi:hypothetical protein
MFHKTIGGDEEIQNGCCFGTAEWPEPVVSLKDILTRIADGPTINRIDALVPCRLTSTTMPQSPISPTASFGSCRRRTAGAHGRGSVLPERFR